MQTHHRGRRTAFGAAVLVTLVAAGACSDTPVEADGLQPGPLRASVSGTFSDEDVFRGLIFMHGPVADAVPYVQTHLRLTNYIDSYDVPDIERVQADAIAQLKAQDPSFIGWFAAEARSGDPVRIEQALMTGGDRVIQALETLPDYKLAVAEMQERQWETDVMLDDQRTLYPVDAEDDTRIDSQVYEFDTTGGGGGGGTGDDGCMDCLIAPEQEMMYMEDSTVEGDAIVAPEYEESTEPDAALMACSPTVCVAGVFLAVGWTAAVAVNYVGGVNVALAVNVYLVWNVRNSLAQSVAMDNLGREQFIASIADTL